MFYTMNFQNTVQFLTCACLDMELVDPACVGLDSNSHSDMHESNPGNYSGKFNPL
jgi:hypothetical protein